MGRSFPAFISRIDENGANIEIDPSYRLALERYCRVCNKTTNTGEKRRRLGEISRKDKIGAAKEQAKIEAEKELKIKEMELPSSTSSSFRKFCNHSTPHNKDAKSPKLPSLIDQKDELDSYLLHFERYAKNASWEKDMWAIKLSALLTGRAMDVYTRMSVTDANDYDKLKKALLTRYKYTEDGYRRGQARD